MGSGLIREETVVAETIEGIADDAMIDPVTSEILDGRLLAKAKEQGVSLVGLGGLLNQPTQNVLEAALNAELTEQHAEWS